MEQNNDSDNLNEELLFRLAQIKEFLTRERTVKPTHDEPPQARTIRSNRNGQLSNVSYVC